MLLPCVVSKWNYINVVFVSRAAAKQCGMLMKQNAIFKRTTFHMVSEPNTNATPYNLAMCGFVTASFSHLRLAIIRQLVDC